MAAPAFDTTAIVLPALRSFALFIAAIVIAPMALVKPAHASGTVAKPSGTNYVYVDPNTGSTGGDGTQPTIQQVIAETLVCNGRYTDVYAMTPCLAAATGYGYQSYWHWAGFWALHLSATSYNSIALGAKFGGVAACPVNSTESAMGTCTCNDPYVPDTAGTSCVPASSCPDHASRTSPDAPCACDAGYQFDAAGTSCVEEQYTLTLEDKLKDVEPGKSASSYVEVVNALTNQPKAGVVVNIKVEVDASSGGHDHGESVAKRDKGTLGGNGCKAGASPGTIDCTTGSDGRAPFTFGAPDASGTHTFTATCASLACSGSKTAKIDVKVDGLWPIPPSGLYALYESDGSVIGATKDRHPSNHYLTTTAANKLLVIAINYHHLYPQAPVLHVNDASLMWGGVFDINGAWQTPHSEHDRGTDIDIRANAELGNVPFENFSGFDKMTTMLSKVDAQVHCTIDKPTDIIQHKRRKPDCISHADGSQDMNRHYHIRLLGKGK